MEYQRSRGTDQERHSFGERCVVWGWCFWKGFFHSVYYSSFSEVVKKRNIFYAKMISIFFSMAHPFSKLFEVALKKTTPDENYVLAEAEKLLEKGYRAEEIYEVLQRLQKSLISDRDEEVLAEATEEFSRYLTTM